MCFQFRLGENSNDYKNYLSFSVCVHLSCHSKIYRFQVHIVVPCQMQKAAAACQIRQQPCDRLVVPYQVQTASPCQFRQWPYVQSVALRQMQPRPVLGQTMAPCSVSQQPCIRCRKWPRVRYRLVLLEQTVAVRSDSSPLLGQTVVPWQVQTVDPYQINLAQCQFRRRPCVRCRKQPHVRSDSSSVLCITRPRTGTNWSRVRGQWPRITCRQWPRIRCGERQGGDSHGQSPAWQAGRGEGQITPKKLQQLEGQATTTLLTSRPAQPTQGHRRSIRTSRVPPCDPCS